MTDTTVWSRALHVLKQQGWRQGPIHNGQHFKCDRLCLTEAGQLCLTEAMAYFTLNDPAFFKKVHSHLGLVCDDVPAIFGDHGFGDAWPIILWNDAPERTFSDVERVLAELHEKELAERGLLHGSG